MRTSNSISSTISDCLIPAFTTNLADATYVEASREERAMFGSFLFQCFHWPLAQSHGLRGAFKIDRSLICVFATRFGPLLGAILLWLAC